MQTIASSTTIAAAAVPLRAGPHWPRPTDAVVKITRIERHAASGMWHGMATGAAKNYEWFYQPRSFLHMREQDDINPRCWMNVEPPTSAKPAVLRAIRTAKGRAISARGAKL